MTPLHPLLRCATPGRWLEAALAEPDLLLLDITHCEKKAAGTALAFIFKTPEHAAVLSRMAREELSHFEWCLRLLEARGGRFERQEPSAYAGELAARCRKKGEGSLMDGYLTAALIEARSGERLVLLRDAVEDPAMKELFAALFPPEERHVELLLDLARKYGEIEERAVELATWEAELILRGERALRMHS